MPHNHNLRKNPTKRKVYSPPQRKPQRSKSFKNSSQRRRNSMANNQSPENPLDDNIHRLLQDSTDRSTVDMNLDPLRNMD